jgi:hypothetical protein
MKRRCFLVGCVAALSISGTSPAAGGASPGKLCSNAGDGAVDVAGARRLGPDAVDFWKRFRKRHSLHVQGSVAGALPSGGAVVVVAEPPPHATEEEIAERLDARGTAIFQSTVGCDGWVRDVVAVLGPRDPIALDEMLTRLDAYLFGTSYRSQQLDLEPDRGPAGSAPVDVSVSPAELRAWTLGDDAIFRSADGVLEVTGRQLAGAAARGVFVSATPGIVLWGIPIGADLCDLKADARLFALDSDLVLGAVKNGSDILVVGRERVLSPDVYPPLRFESMLAVGATKRRSLAQSFQRLNVYAGKLASGDDWAPILLSDELQGTEFGSLLNQTDQMLKSWSMNGQVTYKNFGYPNPAWASKEPIADLLRAQRLTFNWNTGGATTLTSLENLDILTVQRTGALPVTYIPEGTEAVQVAGVEERYHDYFASLQNPLLARAVAYTALYEIFREFGVPASCVAHEVGERAGEATLETRIRKLIKLVRASDPDLRDRLRPVTLEKTEPDLATLKEIFDRVHALTGDDGLAELAHDLAGVTSPSPRFSGISDTAADLLKQQVFREIAQVNDSPDDVLAEFAANARPKATRWLRAPSVVVSRFQSPNPRVTGVGGHNIDDLPALVDLDPSVPRRAPRLVNRGRQPRLTINPADLPSLPDMTPFLKRAQNGRANDAAIAIELAAALKRATPREVRPARTSLALDRFHPYWRGRRSAGWATEPDAARLVSAPPGKPGADDVVRIRRYRDGYELSLPGLVSPPRSRSTLTLTEHVSGYLAAAVGREVRIQLEGFSAEQADMFRLTIKRSSNGPRKDLVLLTGETSVADRAIDARRAVVSVEAPRQVTVDGRPTFECAVQVKPPNLMVRLVLHFKTKITGPLLDGIRAIIARVLNRQPATARALVRELRQELRESLPVGAIDVIVESGAAADYIIAEEQARVRPPAAPL